MSGLDMAALLRHGDQTPLSLVHQRASAEFKLKEQKVILKLKTKVAGIKILHYIKQIQHAGTHHKLSIRGEKSGAVSLHLTILLT